MVTACIGKIFRPWHRSYLIPPLLLLSLQLRILQRAMRMLHPDGRLVYSTCSLNPVENEAVVAEALRANPGKYNLKAGYYSSYCIGRLYVYFHAQTSSSSMSLTHYPPSSADLVSRHGHRRRTEISSSSRLMRRTSRVLMVIKAFKELDEVTGPPQKALRNFTLSVGKYPTTPSYYFVIPAY